MRMRKGVWAPHGRRMPAHLVRPACRAPRPSRAAAYPALESPTCQGDPDRHLHGGPDPEIAQMERILSFQLSLHCAAGAPTAASSVAAGATYRDMLKSPMASPDVPGMSSGASVGAALALLFAIPSLLVHGTSFLCGMATILLVAGGILIAMRWRINALSFDEEGRRRPASTPNSHAWRLSSRRRCSRRPLRACTALPHGSAAPLRSDVLAARCALHRGREPMRNFTKKPSRSAAARLLFRSCVRPRSRSRADSKGASSPCRFSGNEKRAVSNGRSHGRAV